MARGWFPGGVLFTDMRGYDPHPALRFGPGQALEGFLRAVGVPGEHIPYEVQDRSRLLRSVLAAYAAEGRRVLVVVDNVSANGQAQPLLPSDGVCAAIVTSRHVLAELDARLLNLDALHTDHAIDLLDKALRLRNPADSRVRDHPGDAERLADLCAGLPLALQIVAAQLAANPAKPLAAMTADLDDAASRLQEMTFADRAVHAVFDTSYHQLPYDQARLYRLLSLNPGPDISSPAAASLTGPTQAEARRGLEALARAHLIELGTVYGRWRLHDLLRLHSTHHGHAQTEQDQRDQARTRLLEYYLTTAEAANAHLDPRVADPARLGFPDRERALEWLDTEYPNLTAATQAAAAANHPTIARDLPQAMWHFLRWRRHLNDWVTLSLTAIHAARSLADRDGEATALNSLGSALHMMRRFDEAITAHQQVAQICRDTGNRHGEAKALINLGASLDRIGRSGQAVTPLRDAILIFRETGDRVHEGMALNNLGVALWGVQRFEEAVTAHQDAAHIYRETGDRDGEGMALNNLGLTLGETRRFEDAVTAHQDAAQIYRETGNRHGEGMALNNLGLALREMRRFEDAVTAHQDAAQIFRDTGDEYNETLALDHLRRARQTQNAAWPHWWRRRQPSGVDAGAAERRRGRRGGSGRAM